MSLILSGTDGLSDVDGTAATPAIRGTDANTGIFFGTDIIGFSEGGVEAARINADSQFVAAAGTAALPVITTTGDTNTGIFFPAADTIAFAEGGAEAMRLDSAGNMGLGVTPDAWVNAKAIDIATYGSVSADTATSAGITVGYNCYGISATSWKYKNTYNATRYTQEDGIHKWFNAASGTADTAISFTQAMTLDASGNLGVGTSSPTRKLDVATAGTSYIRASNTTNSVNVDMYAATAVGGFGTQSNHPLDFFTNNTDRVRIDTSGNLGIGTASPNAKLVVIGNTAKIYDSSTSNANLQIRNSTTGDAAGFGLQQDGVNTLFYNNSNGFMAFATNATERARIDSSGRLLLGTTTVGTDGPRITVANSNNSQTWQLGTIAAFTPFYVYNNSSVGVYITNGGTSWTSSSDERVKDIIEPIENAITKVSALRTVIGKYKTDEEGTRRSFLIAQDVQAVFPEAVNVQEDEQGTLGLQYTEIIPLLVAAIKEQSALITTLTARINALESA